MEKQVDWNAIRADYENGMSLRPLASKYGISKSVIGERKYKEKWIQRTANRTDSNTQGVINRDVNASVRAAEAVKHRQSGWTYDRIALQCGYASPGAARNAVQRELDRVLTQDIKEWRRDHISRLEKIHEKLWSLVEDGGINPVIASNLISIAEREAKLLGLDASKDIALDAPDVIVVEAPPGYFGGKT